MTRSRSFKALLITLGWVALNCGDWHVLDDVFTRQGPLAGARGWTGGDGATGIRLPGEPDRTLWVFGDSPVTSVDKDGNRIYFPGDFASLANVVFGNSIAIQSQTSSPSPAQIRFYARDGVTGCSNLPDNAPACPVIEITSIANDQHQGFTQFFNHKLLKLAPKLGSDGKPAPGYLWPNAGFVLKDERLLFSFTEIRFCDPTLDGATCKAICGFAGVPESSSCTKGIQIVGNVLARVENPTAALDSWQVSSVRTQDEITWIAFLQKGSTSLYAYGERLNTNPSVGLVKADKYDLVVANMGPDDALDQSKWQYLKGGLWTLNAAPSAMDSIAKVAGTVNITEVKRNNKIGYVLVHDNPFVDHFVYARVGTTQITFPKNVEATTPRLEISAFDKALADQMYVRPFFKACPPPSGPNTSRTCGLNYHATVHPHLSFADDKGFTALVFSYIIPQALLAGGPSAINTYRPSFALLPIDNLSPWCTVAGQPCWSGITFQYTSASLTQGQNSVVTSYDVSKASHFNAALISGSGDPDLYVKFGSPPTTASGGYNCRPYLSSLPETCDLPVPGDQTTAYVMVHGFSASSTYTLRVNYNGD